LIGHDFRPEKNGRVTCFRPLHSGLSAFPPLLFSTPLTMKSNVLPAFIIAAALVACGYFLREALMTNSARQFDAVLTQLEESTQKKPDGSDSRVTTIVKGFSRSVSDGFKAGINDLAPSVEQKARNQAELKARDDILFREVKFAPSQQKSQERVIGLVRNASDGVLSNVQLSILFKDRDGGLLDTGTGYVRGLLRPNEEAPFEVTRSLGDFKEKDEVLAQRKANSVVVTVTGFTKG
jgi:hypothetical protein